MIQANSVSLFSETMPQVNGGATMTRELRRAAIKLRHERAMVQFRDHLVEDWPSGWTGR
jgi:hypothetical protein